MKYGLRFGGVIQAPSVLSIAKWQDGPSHIRDITSTPISCNAIF